MSKIFHHKSSEIGDRVKADVFGHGNKTIALHIDAIGGGVSTSFILGNHMDARALAKMLTDASDAVDPPKQAEPTIEQRISDARQEGYEEGYRDATREHEENS